MSRLFPLTLTALALLAACTEPRCPTRYVQRGMVCKVCPPGSAPDDNECVTIDGGVVVDPVGTDGGPEDDVVMTGDGSTGGARDGGGTTQDGRASDPATDAGGASEASVDATTNADAGNTNSGADSSVELDANTSTDASPTNDASAVVVDASSDATIDAGPPCYADKDKDGVGAGPVVSCEGYGTDAGSSLSLLSTDCDDNNNKRSPSLTDICGDNIDNDCDGTPDDEANNACGGACTAQLAHQPGEKCTNGLLGACARDGTWMCQGTAATVCSAPSVTKGAEVCGDGVDNDCDGAADEADAIDAITWYEDCDGDGYSALTNVQVGAGTGVRVACTIPATVTACAGGWTSKRPRAPQDGIGPERWDCDDTSTSYNPTAQFGMPPMGKTSTDLNCDLVEEKAPFIVTDNPLISGTYLYYDLCGALEDCTACRLRMGNTNGARWAPTSPSPQCSKVAADRREFEPVERVSVLSPTPVVCPNGTYDGPSFGAYYVGLQFCR